MTPTPAHRPILAVSFLAYMRARQQSDRFGLLRLDRQRSEIAARASGGRVVAVVSDAGLTGFAVIARRANPAPASR